MPDRTLNELLKELLMWTWKGPGNGVRALAELCGESEYWAREQLDGRTNCDPRAVAGAYSLTRDGRLLRYITPPDYDGLAWVIRLDLERVRPRKGCVAESLDLVPAVGQALKRIAAALDPDGPGGRVVTPEEAMAVQRAFAALERELAESRAAFERAKAGNPPCEGVL